MIAARTVALVGARIGAGVLALGVCATVAVVAAVEPLPEVSVEPPSVRVLPADSQEVRACAGPLLALAEDSAEATGATALGAPSLVDGAFPDGAAIEEQSALALDVPGADALGGVAWYATAPGEVEPGLLAAASSQGVATERVAGFAAAACTEPVAEAWLAGGAVSVGRTTVLSLVNPGEVAATVRVEVFSELGRLESAGGSLVVAPGTQRVVALSGIAPDARSPVVHVTSTGGRVAATMQQSIVRGLDPGGVAIVSAGDAPATDLVIPGVPRGISGDGDADHVGDDDAVSVVRLLAPDDEDADATVSFHDAAGATLGSVEVALRAGLVADVPVPTLSATVVDVRVRADGPVVAAARVTTGDPDDDAGSDFAWYAAAPELVDAVAVAIAPGPSPRLVLASDGEARAVRVTEGSGAERVVEVPAGGSTSVTVSGGDVLRLDDATGVHASVTYADATESAAYAVLPPGALDAPIRVYPR